jgi:TonB-linked SusC/RagA family outer membrane protein
MERIVIPPTDRYTGRSRWKRGSVRCAAIGVAVGIVSVSAVAQNARPLPAEDFLLARQEQQEEKGRSISVPLVSMNTNDSTISYVLRALSKQAKLQIVFNDANAQFAKRVRVQINQMKIMDAIALVLKGTTLTAAMAPDGETIVVRPRVDTMPANGTKQVRGVVRGRVVDSTTQQGVEGATVSIQGTQLSVTTGKDGQFALTNVPVGDQRLSVKMFGYKQVTRGVTVVEGTLVSLVVTLNPVASVLSGVVTTATGKQRRMEIGNDITTLKVDSIQQIAPVSTVTDLLEARVPGLQVMRTSGQPGAPKRIRLRGTSSINGNNDPIVIVDGVRVYAAQSDTLLGSRSLASHSGVRGSIVPYATPSPLDQIDINSIETIEVFKGPSATSMYGADAANGVIVITTKRGHVGRPTWTIHAKQAWEYMPGKYPTVVRAFGHNRWGESDQTIFCRNTDLHCVIDSMVAFQALNERNLTVLGRGDGTDLSIGVQGGVSSFTYSFTGSGSRQIGLFRLPPLEAERYRTLNGTNAPGWMRRPNRYQTWGGTGTLNIDIGRSTRTTVTSSLFSSDQQQSSLNTSIGQLVNKYVDTMTLSTEPLISGFYERATAASMTSNTAITITSNILPWFPLSTTLGLNTISRTDKTLVPRGAASGRDSAGFFSIGRGSSTMGTINAAAHQIPLGRVFTTSVGTDARILSTAILTSSVKSIPIGVSEPNYLGCPTGAVSIDECGQSSQTTQEESTFGWFIEPKLNLNSRFFVIPGIRLDGGSASGLNAGLSRFPKLNFSWVAVDRSDQPLWGAISMFRPRLAFGIAGVQPGPADKLRLIRDDTLSFEGEATYGSYVDRLGNTKLRPERSREFEGGFDLELWNNRLSVQITQYRKDRLDAIITLPIAQSVLGGNNYQANIGRIRNLGTELSLSTTVLESSKLSWTINGALSKRSNKVVALAPDMEYLQFATFGGGRIFGGGGDNINARIVPGYPPFSFWGYPIWGYRDRNGNGRLDVTEVLVGDTLVYLGDQEPNIETSFNTSLSWHRISLHAAFSYTDGLGQLNVSEQGFSPGLYDPSAPLSLQAAVIAASACTSSNSTTCRRTAYGIAQTVNMLRFHSVSLRYAAPTSVAKRIGGQTLSVALQGQNLGLWTNYRGKDPNVNAFSTGNLTADIGQLPQPRKWLLNVSLTY